MEERTGREQFPVKLWKPTASQTPRRWVETYRRPLPKRMAPPRPASRRRRRRKKES